jgi:T5SS/PEP-CTERM-associated repeat protein
MADDLILTQYSAWTDNIWFDQTTGSLVPAGSDNDLTIATGVGGVMTGTVQADSLTVAEPYPGFGSVEFSDGTVSADAFELSTSSTSAAGVGIEINGADLVTSGTLIVGSGATLEVDGGGTIDSSGSPGLQDFGEIDVNDGTVIAGQMSVQGTFDLISDSGTIATLVVGSYSGEGGLGGTGELEIDSGSTIEVSDALAVAVQTGTGDVNVNGGVLTVNGAADVGEAGEPGTAGGPGIGSLTITAGGSLSFSDTLDIGVTADGGIGTVAVSGDDSTASLGGLVVGDAGNGTLSLDSGAQVTTSDDVVIGNSSGGTGSVTVNGDDTLLDDGGALTVGAGGSGEIDINQGSVEVSAGTITLGESANASGTLTLVNSSLGLSGSLLIGEAGSGSLSVGSDGSLQAQNITLGEATSGGGNLAVGGDGAAVQSSDLTVGTGGSGVLAVSAQGSDTTGAAMLGAEALPEVQQQASVVGGGNGPSAAA